MTKKVITAIVLLIIAAAGIGGFLYWDNVYNFTGERINNPDRYYADFTYFNGSETLTRELRKGDSVRFHMEITKGDVSLIYENDGFATKGIEVLNDRYTADKDGTYVFTIKAKHAAGVIEVTDAEN